MKTISFDNSYARLPEAFYRRVRPTPLSSPSLVSFNAAAAELIGLDPKQAETPEFSEYFSGNRILPGSEPIAAIYAGHQFGSFVPQLGDGRAILLGETINPSGERWDIQLKGAGITPFSRMGDGRAVLRSTIREYLCSEAMHNLGIPTTRALCIVGSDDPVFRETIETAAVLTRLSPTHVRFGTFELFYSRRQFEQVRQLADYTIQYHYPQFIEAKDKYLQFLRTIIHRTANLIAAWQAVGFAHGVMNTDNMSIVGVTIDYGPFGFLDEYDPEFICNHSDYNGRYAFNQQPAVALWNLACLAQTLIPLIEHDAAVEVLNEYQNVFSEKFARLINEKLGLKTSQSTDEILAAELFQILAENAIDYTIFFRRLCDFKIVPAEKLDAVSGMFVDPSGFDDWAKQYRARLNFENSFDAERSARMKRVNPKYVLRNHLAQKTIEAAQNGDYNEINRLLKVLQKPFDEQPAAAQFAEPPPPNAQRIAVSCSS